MKATVLTLPARVKDTPLSFLIDSGAERSLIPASFVPTALLTPADVMLSGVGGHRIPVFGQCSLMVSIRDLRREVRVNFVVVQSAAILGADFITHTGFQLDMRARELRDPLTGLTAKLKASPRTFSVKIVQTLSPPLSEFPTVTAPPDYSSPPTNSVEHTIETTGGPVHCKPRVLSPAKYEAAKVEFDRLLDLGIVRPSSSPWSSPLHVVKKADGTWRPCGDYRALNALTKPDRYAIPNIETFHYRLRGASVFSKLDLVKAYYFIPIAAQDVPKTAICTPFGNFEFLRMGFGLRNAASTFQRFIDSIFRDFPFVVTYIDDILVFSDSEEKHDDHLRAVLTRLDSHGLRINPAKCELRRTSVEFLGYSVQSSGIAPSPSKIQVLRDLPPPQNVKDVRRYIGMFGFYQRFLPNFASIVQPLRDIIIEDDFKWDTSHDRAFSDLKTLLLNSVKLDFPSRDAVLTIATDASATSIGACLHQVVEGVSSPLAFFSRKLSSAETRYSTFDRELLAVFAAIKKWKDFIHGHTVTVFTDHRPIVGAFNSSKHRFSERQQRQFSAITEYVSDIIYVAGKENVVADALSRLPTSSELSPSSTTIAAIDAEVAPEAIDLPTIARQQEKSECDFSKYKSYALDNSLQLYCEVSQPNPRPVIPRNMTKAIFEALHGLSHPGGKATYRLLSSRYFWPTMKADIHTWCSECQACQRSKVGRHTKRPVSELPHPTQRFTNVHIDIVGPLTLPEADSTSRPRYLLTMIDSYTRWLEAVPICDISAATVAKTFLSAWVSRFGPPLTLISDRGAQFRSELIAQITELLGVHHIRTSAYNPRANGMVERVHRSLKTALKARGKYWLEQLPMVLLGIRIYPDEDNRSPFSLTTGEQPLMPAIATTEEGLQQLSTRLHQLFHPYRLPQRRKSPIFVPKALSECDYVWLRLDRVKSPLEAPYQGPYRVISRNDNTFVLDIKSKHTAVAVDRLKPAVVNPIPSSTSNEQHVPVRQLRPRKRVSFCETITTFPK